jgi:hypothetical protein
MYKVMGWIPSTKINKEEEKEKKERRRNFRK